MSMSTPWGRSDHQRRYGKAPRYVVFYGTPSHGGFLVASDMLAKMPAGLAAVKTFAGSDVYGRWYEEDCDWAIVALAFPDLFSEPEVLAAVEMGNTIWDGKPWKAEVRDWLRSPEGAAVCELAARFEAANAAKFRIGSSWTGGEGWIATARNIAGDTELKLGFPGRSYYNLKVHPFTEADVVAAGGLILERSQS